MRLFTEHRTIEVWAPGSLDLQMIKPS